MPYTWMAHLKSTDAAGAEVGGHCHSTGFNKGTMTMCLRSLFRLGTSTNDSALLPLGLPSGKRRENSLSGSELWSLSGPATDVT